MNLKPSARTLTNVGVVTGLVAGLVGVSLLPDASPRAHAAGLTPYESCDPLLAHYREQLRKHATPYGIGAGGYGFRHGGMRLFSGAAESRDSVAAPMPAAAVDSTKAVGSGPTGTNLQEAGVDEPDHTKIADGLIYRITLQGVLHIARAGADPERVSKTTVSDSSFSSELIVAGDRVLVISQGYTETEKAPAGDEPRIAYTDFARGEPITKLSLYDVSDPRAPRRLESYELDGTYVSARLSQGRVRLVTMAWPTVDGVQPNHIPYPDGQPDRTATQSWERQHKAAEKTALEENRRRAARAKLSDILPSFVRRNGAGKVIEKGASVGCTDIHHAKSGSNGSATLVVTTLAPGRGLDALHSIAVTTDGDLVYATADRLVVATSQWGTVRPAGDAITPGRTRSDGVTTELHTFVTGDRDRTDYVASGSVPGYVLGRWALSFHEGHLRVATTLQPPWREGPEDEKSSSSVTVLAERDGSLVATGSVTGLGVGERIQAVRYFGDMATVVTFRRTDPLYVLDLSNPSAPVKRGELKIPGFSTYLHPVGDNRLLGFGHEADDEGRVTGIQISLFDLSNQAKPTQVARLQLGNGHSEALNESRAFSYDPARRTALLPITEYHGAVRSYVRAVKVTEDGRLLTVGTLDTSGQHHASRVLYDGEHVYAVTGATIVAGDADGLRKTGELRL